MLALLSFRHRPFTIFQSDVFHAGFILKSSRITPVAYLAKYSSDIVLALPDFNPEQDSISLSCSLEVNRSPERSGKLCSHEELVKLESSESARSNLIWRTSSCGNPNLGTDSPQNLTHMVPNIRHFVAVDASGIVEPVHEDDIKLPNAESSSSRARDGQPSKHSVKRAAKNEQRKATREAADGLPTCLSSSGDDDLIPSQPPPNQTINKVENKSSESKVSRRPANSATNYRLSKLHKQSLSTQAGFGNVEGLTARTEKASVMDSSTPVEASKPDPANNDAPVPPPQNPNQSQPQQKKEKKPKTPKQPSTPTALPLSPALVDLRVGHILRCVPHENADSLYVSTIAMGDSEGTDHTHQDEETGRIVRTVCSGLRGLIPLEEMQDRKVIVMANLKPVTMRGIKSAAMVLAASPPPKEGEDPHAADRVVELVAPPEGCEGGDKVYFEGWEYGEGKGPEKVLNPKKKQWEGVQPGLYTTEELTVMFDAERVQGVEGGAGELVVEGGKGKCVVPSLKGARLS